MPWRKTQCGECVCVGWKLICTQTLFLVFQAITHWKLIPLALLAALVQMLKMMQRENEKLPANFVSDKKNMESFFALFLMERAHTVKHVLNEMGGKWESERVWRVYERSVGESWSQKLNQTRPNWTELEMRYECNLVANSALNCHKEEKAAATGNELLCIYSRHQHWHRTAWHGMAWSGRY